MCAGDVKLIGSSLQQLQAFASFSVSLVQREDCPQTRFAVKNLPYTSPHPVSLFARDVVAAISQREQQREQ
jgi:hypothetical protein